MEPSISQRYIDWEERAGGGPPAGLRLLVLLMWTIDSPSAAGGGWCAVMALVRPNQCICHKNYDLLWTMNENKESILFVVCKGESDPLKVNQMNCLKFELLDGGTGHCTKLVYCGETNDEHCFVNPWNHSIELMGINSVYGLIHDDRVCNFCVYCGMKTRSFCSYEFCAVMMMLCLLSPQNFTSLSLCPYI